MKPLSQRQFGRFVERVMRSLPPSFAPYLVNLVVDVEDSPNERLLKDQEFSADEIAEGASLYGLFESFPMPDTGDLPGVDGFEQPMNRIIIYKQPLEEDFDDPKELFLEIRKTVIHELAHHFGLTERDLERFEETRDPFGDDGKTQQRR